jgi:hypothetical protein
MKKQPPVKAYRHKLSKTYINALGEVIEPEEDFEMLMAIWRVMAGCTAFVIIVYIILKTTTP